MEILSALIAMSISRMTMLEASRFSVVIASCLMVGCIGGAGYDNADDTSAAEQYPAVVADRVIVRTDTAPFRTYSQTQDHIFDKFAFHATPIKNGRAIIQGSAYDIAYSTDDFLLQVHRSGSLVVERRLPNVFYMHPLAAALIPGDTISHDRVLLAIRSRATTGLCYVGIFDGQGATLYEKVMSIAQVWDIQLDSDSNIVIGGARQRVTVIRQ